MPEERPNVLFVILDTARASAFDADSSSRTPTYARLASEGAVFAHAITPAPWTLPSHVSFFSGLMPSAHGMMGDAWGTNELPNVTPLIERTGDAWLPKAAHAAGYETFGAVANGWVGPRTGFDAHFDSFFTTVGDAHAGTSARVRRKIRSTLRPGDDGAARLVRAFEKWHAARGNERRPFFAFFNFLEPHAPYDPPDWRRGLSAGERKRVKTLLSELHRPAELMLPYNLGSQDLNPDDLAILRRLYEEEVSVADRAAGRLLDRLRSSGELERTIVVLASDHGENVGEHHLLAHNMSLHETLLHVPLVIAGPNVPPATHGQTVSALGLHPALVEAMTGRPQAGSLLSGPADDIASEYESAQHQVRALGAMLTETDDRKVPPLATHKGCASYRGMHKAVASAGHVEVFDLSSDPDEVTPLEGSLAADARAASDAAAAGLEQLERRSGHTENTAVLDEEIRAHLEGLGYL